MQVRIPTGIAGLDLLLGGGWAAGRANIIYGPPSSFKSTICRATAAKFASTGCVVFYLDTEDKVHIRPRYVYWHVYDFGELFDRLVDVKAKLRFLNPVQVLVVIDSLSAVLHENYLQNPGYGKSLKTSLDHLLRQIIDEGATVLLTSWELKGRYIGRNLDPAVVVRTRKKHDCLLVILEKSDGTLLGHEMLDFEEVLKPAV